MMCASASVTLFCMCCLDKDRLTGKLLVTELGKNQSDRSFALDLEIVL